MTDLTNYDSMETTDLNYLTSHFVTIVQSLSAEALIGIVEYYPEEGFVPEIKKLYTLILSYFNPSESDATLDFFVEDYEEVILFIVAHENRIELNKKFLNNSI